MDSEFANGRALKGYIDQAVDQALRKIISLQNLETDHAFTTGTTVALTSTINVVATVTVTPKLTGRFRVIGMGSVANSSTLQAAVSFQIQTQTTTGATASTVQACQNIEIPGTSVTGYATPNMQWAVMTETSAGFVQPVGVAGNILINANPGTTNVLTVLTGSLLDVQEIL